MDAGESSHLEKTGWLERAKDKVEGVEITNAMVLWALSGFCVGIIVLGGFILAHVPEKFADYLSYSLPCLAAVTFGGNFIKPEADRWMFVVSIILLIGGYNAYLYNYQNVWVIYLVEIVMIIAYFGATLYHLRHHDEAGKSRHGNIAERIFFGSAIVLAFLAGVVGLIAVFFYS